jgi:hypothetical protein
MLHIVDEWRLLSVDPGAEKQAAEKKREYREGTHEQDLHLFRESDLAICLVR